ncbi:MAG: hypothetical protein KJ676_08015 [Alphaproteobacteria bacterium]|nr:hypothetical protein [Alphaproteobacteria bacterium]MBU1525577.1 hypothetical protein [Alphaproteobacteria bacterium]MBU2117977.1 hypothetical protein [Alphaproteobacteria bacterium]MBU2350243.1 hypothetical protein [Alphaproteobacteria bacterium]MBU2381387.1 hypothetical protein [Alphaproteobacteria bacterium]
MLAVAAAALLLAQDPVLTQAEYEAFQTCHGQFEGAYAVGQAVMADDAAALSEFREIGAGLGELFDEFSTDILRVQPGLDVAAGDRAFQRGRASWDGVAGRPDAMDVFADNGAISDDCIEAGGRVAEVLDAAGG